MAARLNVHVGSQRGVDQNGIAVSANKRPCYTDMAIQHDNYRVTFQLLSQVTKSARNSRNG
jgi:hypothetical protein